jgi:hypothetical protein
VAVGKSEVRAQRWIGRELHAGTGEKRLKERLVVGNVTGGD